MKILLISCISNTNFSTSNLCFASKITFLSTFRRFSFILIWYGARLCLDNRPSCYSHTSLSLLRNKVISLADSSLEQIVVLQYELYIIYGQVDKHSGNLGRLRADQLADKLIEDGSNLILVIGVFWNDSWQNLIGCHHILLIDS